MPRLLPSWLPHYKAFRKKGVPRIGAMLAVTAHDFQPELLQKKTLGDHFEKLGESTNAALMRFKGRPNEYFNATSPTVHEFYSYLLGKGIEPAKAWHEARVRQKSSMHYDLKEIREHTLHAWSRWMGGQVAKKLCDRNVNRESSNRIQELSNHLTTMFEKVMREEGRVASPNLTVFWGGHKEGEKEYSPEDRALKHLADLRDGVKNDLGVDFRVHVIFSDMHSRHINGVDEARIHEYNRVMLGLTDKYRFGFYPLSDEWKNYGPADVTGMLGTAGPLMETLEKLNLVKGAAKRAERHSERARAGQFTTEEASKAYFLVRSIEKNIFERRATPETIYGAYGDPKESREFHPSPTIFLWSERRGMGQTPWFGRRPAEAEKRPSEAERQVAAA